MMEKNQLRTLARERLSALTQDQYKEMGLSMLEQLRSLPEYQQAQRVFCFVGAENEPDTIPILKAVVADGKALCVPKIVGKGAMIPLEIPDFSSLMPGLYGIPEPLTGRARTAGEIDLTILPCLACSRSGHRLGHGWGCYDRFIQEYQGPSLALCPSVVLYDEIPLEDHDQPVHRILTGEELLSPGL